LRTLIIKAGQESHNDDVEALWTAVGSLLLTAFSTDECANYCAKAGYRCSS